MGYVAGLMAHKKGKRAEGAEQQGSKGAEEEKKMLSCFLLLFFCQNPITPSGDGPKKHPDGATR